MAPIQTRASCIAFGLCLASATASMAHPDVWVTMQYKLGFSETALTELEVVWAYDVFYSDRAISQYDTDGDSAFSAEEAGVMQEALFGPIAAEGYFVRVFVGETAQRMRLERFAPAVEGDQLAITFSLIPETPIEYRAEPVAIATYDDTVFDFSLAEQDFLRVDGAFDANCRFRVQAGDGPLEGAPQTIMLICPD